MASKALDIIIKVRDAASGKLRDVNKSLEDTGKAVKKTGVDFTEFNRTMFSTTAFVGLFQRAFSNFGSLITEGAQLDRVEDQFERVLGPSGNLFQAIKGLTGTSIDRVEAMRAGIALKTLGIGKDLGEVAEFIARSGEAAKMAGLDAAEGVKHFTQFVKTGSIANLEFLNLIRGSDPAFKLQMSMLEKVGGVMGSALTAQEKYNRGIALLRMATRNMSKDNRDLVDITTELGQSFKFFKGEIGTFLGTAISPLLMKLSDLFDSWSLQLQSIRKNDKDLMFLGRAFIYVTGAVSGLVAVLGTLRLAVKALTFVGVGVPALVKLIAVLAAGFIGLTQNADKMSDKITGPFDNLLNRLKLIGGFFRGVYQLFSSFFEPDNFVRGIGKIDTALYNMLDQTGLLGFTVALARMAVVVKVFGQSVIEQMGLVSKWINDKLGGAFSSIASMLGLSKGAGTSWSRVLIDNTNSVHKALARLTVAFIGLWAASKVFKSFGSIMSNMPIIGGFFGSRGGRGGPKGTKSDPLYVVENGKLVAGIFKKSGVMLEKLALKIPFLANMLTHPEGKMAGLFESVKGLFSKEGMLGSISDVVSSLGKLAEGLTTFAELFLIFKAGQGLLTGFFDNFQSFKDLGGSLVNWVESAFSLMLTKIENTYDVIKTKIETMFDRLISFLENKIPGFKTVSQVVKNVADVPDTVEWAWKQLGDFIGGMAGVGAQKINESARSMDISNIQSSGIVTKSLLPETSEGRAQVLQQAATDMYDIDQGKSADIARAMRAAMQDNYVSPEEFANALGAKLDSSLLTKAAVTTATETKKQNNKSVINNKPRTGGCG